MRDAQLLEHLFGRQLQLVQLQRRPEDRVVGELGHVDAALLRQRLEPRPAILARLRRQPGLLHRLVEHVGGHRVAGPVPGDDGRQHVVVQQQLLRRRPLGQPHRLIVDPRRDLPQPVVTRRPERLEARLDHVLGVGAHLIGRVLLAGRRALREHVADRLARQQIVGAELAVRQAHAVRPRTSRRCRAPRHRCRPTPR